MHPAQELRDGDGAPRALRSDTRRSALAIRRLLATSYPARGGGPKCGSNKARAFPSVQPTSPEDIGVAGELEPCVQPCARCCEHARRQHAAAGIILTWPVFASGIKCPASTTRLPSLRTGLRVVLVRRLRGGRCRGAAGKALSPSSPLIRGSPLGNAWGIVKGAPYGRRPSPG
jgi:hypothetical protein